MKKYFPTYLLLMFQLLFSFPGSAQGKEDYYVYCIGLQWLAPQSMLTGMLDFETSLSLLQRYQEEYFQKTGENVFPLKDENLDNLEKVIFNSIKHSVYKIFSKYSKSVGKEAEEEKNRELEELILQWQNPANDRLLPTRLKKKISLLEKILFKKSLVEEIMNKLLQMDTYVNASDVPEQKWTDLLNIFNNPQLNPVAHSLLISQLRKSDPEWTAPASVDEAFRTSILHAVNELLESNLDTLTLNGKVIKVILSSKYEALSQDMLKLKRAQNLELLEPFFDNAFLKTKSSITIMAPGLRMTALNKVSYAYADTVRNHMGDFFQETLPGKKALLSHNKWITFGLNNELLQPSDRLGDKSELEYLYVHGSRKTIAEHEKQKMLLPRELLSSIPLGGEKYEGDLKERLIHEIEEKKEVPEEEKDKWIKDMEKKSLNDVNLYSYTREFNNLYMKLVLAVNAGNWTAFEDALNQEQKRLLGNLYEIYKDFKVFFEQNSQVIPQSLFDLFKSNFYPESEIEKLGLDESTKQMLLEKSKRLKYIRNILKDLRLLTDENSPWKKFLTSPALTPQEEELQRKERVKKFIWSEVFPKAVEIANRIFDEHEGLSRGQELFYSQKMGQSWYPPKVYKSLRKTADAIEECPMYNDMRGTLSKAADTMSFTAFNALMTDYLKDLIRNERDHEFFEKEFFPLISALKFLNIHDELFNAEAGTTRKFEFSTTIDGDEHRSVISGVDGRIYTVCFDFDNFQVVDQQLRKLNLLTSDDSLFFRIHETLDSLLKEKISRWLEAGADKESFRTELEGICKEAIAELPYHDNVKVNLNPGRVDEALKIYTGNSILDTSVYEVKNYLEQLEQNAPQKKRSDPAFLSRLEGYREGISRLLENQAEEKAAVEMPLGDFLAQLSLKRGELPRLARGVWGSVGVSGAAAQIHVTEKSAADETLIDNIRNTVNKVDEMVPLLKSSSTRFIYDGTEEADVLNERYHQNELAKKERIGVYHSAGPKVIMEIFPSMRSVSSENLGIILDTLSNIRTEYTPQEIYFNDITLDAAEKEIEKIGGAEVSRELEKIRKNGNLESLFHKVIAKIEMENVPLAEEVVDVAA